MASQYQQIAGVKYERDLLEIAAARAKVGSLRKADAVELWEKAMDGGRVTAIEARTLRHIMDVHKVEKAARSFLEGKLQEDLPLVPKASGSSALAPAAPGSGLRRKSSQYYTVVDGIRYDRALLEEAQDYAERGALTLENVSTLWAHAHDGQGVTVTERRTLVQILETHKFKPDAEQFFRNMLGLAPWGQDRARLPAPQQAASLEAPASQGGGWLQSLAAPLSAVRSWFGGSPSGQKRPLEDASEASGAAAKRPALAGAAATAEEEAMPGSSGSAPSSQRPALQGGSGAQALPAGGSSAYAGSASGSSRPAGRAAPGRLLDALSPELRSLLQEQAGGDQPSLALEWPSATAPSKQDDLARQRALVEQEVERILALKKVTEILGTGTREEQHQEFKRIALLLHPDKGLVSKDDDRAALAMQLALVALNKARRKP